MLWLAALLACHTPSPEPWANVAPAEVLERLDGDGRVYLRLHEGDWTYWAAVPPLDAQVGDSVLLGKGHEDRFYRSVELDRTFPQMILIDAAKVASAEDLEQWRVLEPPPGGLAIADLFAQRTTLGGQPIAVRGRIVKVNKGIFGKNWFHLRDGTGTDGTNDLTVTSDADLEPGAVVVATGTLTVDKDLGFGYFYPAIVEDGTITPE